MPFPRNPNNWCKCGKHIKNSRSGLCRPCYKLNNIIKFGQRLLSDCESTYARHKYQKIRNHAHKIMNYYKIEKQCKICSYNKHVELCHIKPIHKFSKQTTFNVINSIDNLVYLCPNHHWELENNFITLTS